MTTDPQARTAEVLEPFVVALLEDPWGRDVDVERLDIAAALAEAGLLADHAYCNDRVDRADQRTDAARAELAEWKHLANHRSPVDLSRLKERIKTLEAELAKVKAQRNEAAMASARALSELRKVEAKHDALAAGLPHTIANAERRGAVAALREAADAVGSDGDWLRARAVRLTEGGA